MSKCNELLVNNYISQFFSYLSIFAFIEKCKSLETMNLKLWNTHCHTESDNHTELLVLINPYSCFSKPICHMAYYLYYCIGPYKNISLQWRFLFSSMWLVQKRFYRKASSIGCIIVRRLCSPKCKLFIDARIYGL